MRTRTYTITAVATLAIGLSGVSAANAADPPMAGDYAGKGQGVKTTLTVDDVGDGALKFNMKASCGAVKGSLDLTGASNGDLKGKRVSGKKTYIAKVSPSRTAGVVSGTVRYVAPGDDGTCKGKRTFDAKVDLEGSPMVDELSGRYSGEGDDGGLPISFDVGFDKAERVLAITNVDFQTDTECWPDANGVERDLKVSINDLSGEVDPDGWFEIDYTPDDNTEFYVEGQLSDGDAELYVEVGGYFTEGGAPAFGSGLECDSWGEDYFASKNG